LVEKLIFDLAMIHVFHVIKSLDMSPEQGHMGMIQSYQTIFLDA
jgi:hypothetical protein